MRIPSSAAHNRWHPDLEPVARVAPGDVVTLETRDGLDGLLTRESTHADCARLELGLGHPLTGPVHVEGAEPGDVLEVELLAYETPAFGVNGVIPGFGFLADLFTEPFLVGWELDGTHARSAELPGIAVPACVHAGVIGVAPSHELMEKQRAREELIRAAGGPVADDVPDTAFPTLARAGLRTIPPRENGGNLDIRRLVAGVDAAPARARPGRAPLARRRPLRPGRRRGLRDRDRDRGGRHGAARPAQGAALVAALPGLPDPAAAARARFATTGIPEDDAMDLTQAARAALLAMIDWLEAEHGLSRPAAYCLCSACVDLHLSQVVDIPYPLVSALIPLDVFERS